QLLSPKEGVEPQLGGTHAHLAPQLDDTVGEATVRTVDRSLARQDIRVLPLERHDLSVDETDQRISNRFDLFGHHDATQDSSPDRASRCPDELTMRNFGRVTSSVTGTNSTSTRSPIRTSSGCPQTMLVIILGPSSSSTRATT